MSGEQVYRDWLQAEIVKLQALLKRADREKRVLMLDITRKQVLVECLEVFDRHMEAGR